MVGAGAVVLDAPAELGEHQDDGVLVLAVLFQVVHEVGYGYGDFAPQLGVGREFVGVGVEAAVLGVEDARSDVGEHDLGYVLHVLGYGVVGVFDVGGVGGGGRPEYVGAFEGVHSDLAYEAGDGVLAGAAVYLGEGFEREGAGAVVLDVGHEAVGVEVSDGGDGDVLGVHGAGEAATEVDAGDDVFAFGVEVAHGLSEPAFGGYVVGFGGVPDVHGAEVRPVGAGVAYAVYDGHLAVVPEGLYGGHRGVESEPVVQVEDFVLGDAEVLPVVVVVRVRVWYDGVQSVVSAAKLQHHHGLFAAAVRCHGVLLY